MLNGSATNSLNAKIVLDYPNTISLSSKDLNSNVRLVASIFNTQVRTDFIQYSWWCNTRPFVDPPEVDELEEDPDDILVQAT